MDRSHRSTDDQRPFGSPRLTVIVSWEVVHRFATFQAVRMEHGVSRLLLQSASSWTGAVGRWCLGSSGQRPVTATAAALTAGKRQRGSPRWPSQRNARPA